MRRQLELLRRSRFRCDRSWRMMLSALMVLVQSVAMREGMRSDAEWNGRRRRIHWVRRRVSGIEWVGGARRSTVRRVRRMLQDLGLAKGQRIGIPINWTRSELVVLRSAAIKWGRRLPLHIHTV